MIVLTVNSRDDVASYKGLLRSDLFHQTLVSQPNLNKSTPAFNILGPPSFAPFVLLALSSLASV